MKFKDKALIFSAAVFVISMVMLILLPNNAETETTTMALRMGMPQLDDSTLYIKTPPREEFKSLELEQIYTLTESQFLMIITDATERGFYNGQRAALMGIILIEQANDSTWSWRGSPWSNNSTPIFDPNK